MKNNIKSFIVGYSVPFLDSQDYEETQMMSMPLYLHEIIHFP